MYDAGNTGRRFEMPTPGDLLKMKANENPDNVNYRAVEEEPANEVKPGATRCRGILLSTPPAAHGLLVLHPVRKDRRRVERVEVGKQCKVRFLYHRQATTQR